MIQDPSLDVLRPMTEVEAESFCDLPVRVRAHGATAHGLPTELMISISGKESMVATAAEKLDAIELSSYSAALDAFSGGKANQSAAIYLSAALDSGPVAPSLYGLASALVWLDEYAVAGEIARNIAGIPGFTDPRAAALAGYAAFKLGMPKKARANLALASRLARGNREFRPVQRFCQAVLLTQHFGATD